MIRTPLRPLAAVLRAREKGENPDLIEADARAKRNHALAAKLRRRSEMRLGMLGLCFLGAFGTVGTRMAMLASSTPTEPTAAVSGSMILNQRADIVDRNGTVLATNLATMSLYAQPHRLIEPERAAQKLAEIFPDLKQDRLVRDFTSGKRKFIWVRKKISPEQRQLVHDLGEPGLLFGPREMRLYPNGHLAAHILGGASFGKEGVDSAEVVGVAGVEKKFDKRLRDPAYQGEPLRLSIDLTAQAASEQVLSGGMTLMSAKGAASILMDVKTGEILSLVSLPDFDPNNRPRPLTEGDQSDSPLFNRAAQGVYELGSTFKPFAATLAMDQKMVEPSTMIDIKTRLSSGGYTIKDYKYMGKELSVEDIIIKSSNIGTSKLALMTGSGLQQSMLADLGFFEKLSVELTEASISKPLLPKRWTELYSMTVSYGHGISATPLHLAAGYAALANGGYAVTPTLIKQTQVPVLENRVFSKASTDKMLTILRKVVGSEKGTASMADVPGYSVAGKTGSAEKYRKGVGGYHKDKLISTFASVFPSHDPKYVLVVMLDEPKIDAFGEERRTAGWTAAPIAGEMIARLAPILNLRPQLAAPEMITYTAVKN
jgi:cell division protein FtsI (penicillin-binding protein 3)